MVSEAAGGAGFLARLRSGLKRTSDRLSLALQEAVSGRTRVDASLYEELEAALLEADLGVGMTEAMLGALERRVREERIEDPGRVRGILREELERLLRVGTGGAPSSLAPALASPHVVLVVGVNGVGKTTTIGKLARLHARAGRSVVLAAADTFRAAAAEQLAIWAERSGARLVRHQDGADPAAVVYDALEMAAARRTDVLILDTAGRLHNKDNLMSELEKMRRVLGKRIAEAPHETLLVLDGTTGQNALSQAREFKSRIGITGLVVTKVDGTAKGGVVAAIVSELGIPVRFLGTGEGLDDLIEFDAHAFAEALFA
jgi:fused signal recognition particle receptor